MRINNVRSTGELPVWKACAKSGPSGCTGTEHVPMVYRFSCRWSSCGQRKYALPTVERPLRSPTGGFVKFAESPDRLSQDDNAPLRAAARAFRPAGMIGYKTRRRD